MGDVFWINDPSILFEDGNWYKIIPMQGMTTNEVLNSLTLLVFYLTVIALVFTRSVTLLLLGIVAILAIIGYYYYQKPKLERFRNKPVRWEQQRTDRSVSLEHPDTIGFAEWVYRPPVSCKENPLMCSPGVDDPRFLRRQY